MRADEAIQNGNLATKADLVKVHKEIADLRVEIAEVRADGRTVKWMMGFIIAFCAGILFSLLRLLGG